MTELRKDEEPKFREVRKQTDERLQQVLTPHQWEQYKQMIEEFRKTRPFGRGRRESQH
jgi:hypothetical protein